METKVCIRCKEEKDISLFMFKKDVSKYRNACRVCCAKRIILDTSDLPGEEWKDIKEFIGVYKISSLGRVKSLARIVNTISTREKILKNVLNRYGYEQITLNYKIKNKKFAVHRLVAEAFIPNPEKKPHVNHINGIKNDNKLENLEWVTPLENVRHAYDSGLIDRTNKRKTIEQYTLDGVFIKEYKGITVAADSLGIGMYRISACLRGIQPSTCGFVWKYK